LGAGREHYENVQIFCFSRCTKTKLIPELIFSGANKGLVAGTTITVIGGLNTLLYIPSRAIYPVEGFPVWLRWISCIDPFPYVVHALKALLLKNTGFPGI
jgi:hypothetical protein